MQSYDNKDILKTKQLEIDKGGGMRSIGQDPQLEFDIDDYLNIDIDIIEVVAYIDKGTIIEVFWQEEKDENYLRDKSIRKRVVNDKKFKYSFSISRNSNSKIKRLRIDPTNVDGAIIEFSHINIYSKEERKKKINVGCGPKDRKEGWINIDIQPFGTVDKVMDVTKEWDFRNVDFIYAEHFLEHLKLEDAISFLINCFIALKKGGKIRITTPDLQNVQQNFNQLYQKGEIIISTFEINRAFHGWGHNFLYTREFLHKLLNEIGFVQIKSCLYGISDDEELSYVEQHEGNVIIFEAEKGMILNKKSSFITMCYNEFIKYNNALG